MNPFFPSIQSRCLAVSLAVLLPLVTSGCMTYRVNSLADAPDANPGDRKCERAVSPGSETGGPDGLCTLRAAVMESNASVWKDTVEVPSGLYQLTLPVAAGGGRLAITDGVKIQGSGAASTIIDGNHADIVALCPKRGPRAEQCDGTGRQQSGRRRNRSTTVSGNLAHSPDAGTGGISQNGFAVLYNVTITNNTGVGNNAESFRGGGIQIGDGKTTVVKNSIIAGNHGGTGPNDCVGQLSGDSKYNLIGDTNGCTIPSFVSIFLLNVDPLIGPLANHGGPTQTHLPAGNSPVLEAGYQFPPPAADGCEVRDQRGVPRPQGAGVCDMGAVEVTSANTFVTGLTLVDADSNTDIRPLLHGDMLVLSELPPELSIRAVVTGAPGSVVFGYDGTPAIQTENVAPYALAGDSPAGDYNPFALSTGSHTLTATPFAGMGGGGAAGGSQTISFSVRN